MNSLCRKKRLIFAVRLALAGVLLAGILGCGTSGQVKTGNITSDQIASAINEIALELSSIDNGLSSENPSGKGYLDEEDKQTIERMDVSLTEVEKQLHDAFKGFADAESCATILIAKESLRMLANALFCFMHLKDSNLEVSYILDSLFMVSGDHRAESFRWLGYIFGWDANPYNEQQLIAYLLAVYMRSALENSILSCYETDSRILAANREDMQGILDRFNENLKRIAEEIEWLVLPGEWESERDLLIETVEEMHEQNVYLDNCDWPISDQVDLNNMLEDLQTRRAAIFEKLMPKIEEQDATSTNQT